MRDTGPGLSAATMTALNTGVGLTNTRSRLEQLFGDRHRFEFHEPPDGGLAVKIRIPFVIHPDSHPDVGDGERRVNKIRALVVDDEPLARERVLSLLQQEADVEVVGECSDGGQAVSAIQQQSPDLVFLDVQMPGCDGFEVIQNIGAERMPMVVFVTAYDEYALQAFEVHALDYLLKPFGKERFRETLKHAREALERRRAGDLGRRLLALVNDVKPEPPQRRAPGREVGRPRVLPAHRGDRLDRGRGQLRAPAPRRARSTCFARR